MAKFFEMHGSVMATYEAAGRRFGISAKACKERWHRRGGEFSPPFLLCRRELRVLMFSRADGLKFSHGKGAAGKENVQPEASGSGTTSLAGASLFLSLFRLCKVLQIQP